MLDEPNHCLAALRVELVVITRLNSHKLAYSLLNCLLERVFGNLVFDVVPKVGQKANSIVQFNVEGLVVDSCPFALNGFTVALLAFFAEDCLSLVVLHQIDPVDIFILELKLMALVDQLHLVWDLVGAHLLGVEEVHGL